MKLKLLSKFFVLPSTVLLLTSNASGEAQFQPAEIYSIGSRAEAVTVADLNNDGRDDVAIITSQAFDPDNDFQLKVFLQNQAGQLQDAVNYPLSSETESLPKSLAVGDINSDGRKDIAIGFAGEKIETFLQTEDGGLTAGETYLSSYATNIAIGDLKGDGVNEIVGVSKTSDGVESIRQAPQPFGQVRSLSFVMGHESALLTLGDVNRDYVDDIVMLSEQPLSTKLAVMESNPFSSQIAYYDFGSKVQANGISTGDINGDGFNDVVVSLGDSAAGAGLAVFFQDSERKLQIPVFFSTQNNPGPILTTLLQDKESARVLMLPKEGFSLTAYGDFIQNLEASKYEINIPVGNYSNPQSIATGDINSDGAVDIVIANPQQGLITLKGSLVVLNQPPQAIAGGDQSVGGGSLVVLDGSQSSDPDGNIVAYHWKQLSGAPVSLMDSGDGVVNFIAPAEQKGIVQELVFELEVEDDHGLVSIDQSTVRVGTNLAPVVVVENIGTIKAGQSVRLDASESFDMDGEIVSARWSQLSGDPVELMQLERGVATFTVPVFGGPLGLLKGYVFEVEVEDNGGQKSKRTIAFIAEGLKAPIVVPGEPQEVKPGQLVQLDGRESYDSDGKIVSYNWSASGLEINNNPDGTASFIAPEIAADTQRVIMVTLSVKDDDGYTGVGFLAIRIVGNSSPRAQIVTPLNVKQNSLVTLDGSNSIDEDGTIISYQWQQVGGPEVSLENASAAITTFIAPNKSDEEYTSLAFQLTVTDDQGDINRSIIMLLVE
ncbi:PKD domain-containing protein [Microbulbifer sp. VAAC004]|uniref:PKD domain-containing protein n=1 Tax=unclassified Microbulbifer TaxID=2619833 RepID=UPI00403A71D8